MLHPFFDLVQTGIGVVDIHPLTTRSLVDHADLLVVLQQTICRFNAALQQRVYRLSRVTILEAAIGLLIK